MIEGSCPDIRHVKGNQAGSVMLEGLIAVLIFSLGILAVVGLQAASIRSSSESRYRIDANLAASRLLSRMWADPASLSDYDNMSYEASASNWLGNDLPNGSAIVDVDGNEVLITIKWKIGADGHEHTYQTTAQIDPAVEEK